MKDIVSTPSGLRYVDFAPGSGAPPRFGQLVRFHYVGYTASKARDDAYAGGQGNLTDAVLWAEQQRARSREQPEHT